MSAVSVSESGVRPLLADAVDLARRALLELEPAGVGAHLGVAAEDDSAATHRFEATLAGYRGWQWAVVVAAPPEADYATVSESALLPGPDALVAPDFVPWDQRVRPGDLAPGDLLAPPPNDPRLVPGYVATGDPVVDEVAYEVGLGRTQVLSLEGREEAAERWHAEYGPETEMAKAAPSTCGLCGFYLPLAGSLRAAFGVCGNAMGADGRVVHAAYGCGAHSDTVAPTGGGSPLYEAFDDAAVELIPTADLTAPEPKVDLAEAPVAEVKSADAVAEVAPEATAAEAGSAAPVAEASADVVSVEAPELAAADINTVADVAAPVADTESADAVAEQAAEVSVADAVEPVAAEGADVLAADAGSAVQVAEVSADVVEAEAQVAAADIDAAVDVEAAVTDTESADAVAEQADAVAVSDADASAVDSAVAVDADDAQAADAPVADGDSADDSAAFSAGAESSDSVIASGFGAAASGSESTEAGASPVDSAGVGGSDVAVSADVEQAAEDAAQAPAADVSVEGVAESRAVESSPEN